MLAVALSVCASPGSEPAAGAGSRSVASQTPAQPGSVDDTHNTKGAILRADLAARIASTPELKARGQRISAAQEPESLDVMFWLVAWGEQSAADVDLDALDMDGMAMIEHHRGAIEMADTLSGPPSHAGAAGEPTGSRRQDEYMPLPSTEPHPAPGTRPRVLVVDDEAPLARLVTSYLDRDGFEAKTVGDGRDAITQARDWDPAVIVLDLGLPGVDGVEVCRAVRTFSDCYIIMLTARVEEIDKLVGLSVGADDYLTKPFSPRELVARVRAMLRRPRLDASATDPEPQVIGFGELSIDVVGREVRVAGVLVDLTRTEFDVLAALAAHPGMVFTRSRLIEAVWGGVWLGDEHLVDVHIGHVRRKLGDDPAAPIFIRTVRGVGYRMGPGR